MISEHNQELFNRLRDLHLPKGEYAIFGSGPLGVRGLHDCHDLDIIVTQKIYQDYKSRPEWTEKVTLSGSTYLDNSSLELYHDWKPGTWNIAQLIHEAEIIDDLPFVQLKHVIEWKKLNGRAKDIEHLTNL